MKRELDGLITQMHSSGIPYSDAVRQFKKRYILEVLAHHKGNQCKAADELGMHRNTLSRTLSELDLDTAQIRSPDSRQIRNGMRRPPSSERPNMQHPPRTVSRERRPPCPFRASPASVSPSACVETGSGPKSSMILGHPEASCARSMPLWHPRDPASV